MTTIFPLNEYATTYLHVFISAYLAINFFANWFSCLCTQLLTYTLGYFSNLLPDLLSYCACDVAVEGSWWAVVLERTSIRSTVTNWLQCIQLTCQSRWCMTSVRNSLVVLSRHLLLPALLFHSSDSSCSPFLRFYLQYLRPKNK